MGWGRTFEISKIEDKGMKVSGTGYGPRSIKVGDIVMLTNRESGGIATYKLMFVKFWRDPRDMYRFEAEFDGGSTFTLDDEGDIVRVGAPKKDKDELDEHEQLALELVQCGGGIWAGPGTDQKYALERLEKRGLIRYDDSSRRYVKLETPE